MSEKKPPRDLNPGSSPCHADAGPTELSEHREFNVFNIFNRPFTVSVYIYS